MSLFFRQYQFQGHRGSVYALQASGNHLYSAGGDGWIARWDLTDPGDGKLVAQVTAQLFSLCLPTRGPFACVAGDMNGGIHWLDLHETLNNRHWSAHKKGVFDLLEKDQHLLSLGGDGLITWWNIESARSAESIELSRQALRKGAFSPDGQWLAIGASDGNIYLLDAAERRLVNTILDAHQPAVFALCFSPDGHYLFSGGRDAHLKIWDVRADFICVRDQPAHWYTINDLLFIGESNILVSASRDKTIRIWNGDTGALLQTLDSAKSQGHINSVNRLCALPGSQCFASASDDKSMIIWQPENLK